MALPENWNDARVVFSAVFMICGSICLLVGGVAYDSNKNNLDEFNAYPRATINETRCVQVFGNVLCKYTFVFSNNTCMLQLTNQPILSPNITYVIDGKPNCVFEKCDESCDTVGPLLLVWIGSALIPIGILIAIIHCCIKKYIPIIQSSRQCLV